MGVLDIYVPDMFIQIFNAFNNNSVYTKDTDWCRQTHLQTVNMVNWCFYVITETNRKCIIERENHVLQYRVAKYELYSKQIAYLRIFPKSSETHREVVLLSL